MLKLSLIFQIMKKQKSNWINDDKRMQSNDSIKTYAYRLRKDILG